MNDKELTCLMNARRRYVSPVLQRHTLKVEASECGP